MTSLLQQLDIFELCPLITNLSCKLSTVSGYNVRQQLLCLVSEENDIVLRYTDETGQEVLKLISWFRRTNRVIHDVCFDPSGTWLLVLCFDNTLHIVPALAVVDLKNYPAKSVNAVQQHLYNTKQITSYIIPFVGPHECPNSKNCPNNNATHTTTVTAKTLERETTKSEEKNANVQELALNMEQLKVNENEEPEAEQTTSAANNNKTNYDKCNCAVEANVAVFSHDLPAHMLATNTAPNQNVDKTGNSHVMATSFMASNTCPYPLSVVWWQTLDGVNRAIIGYSDGSICFVALSPNCPFIASTAIESGSVVKLLICRDNTFDSVMLLITSSMKRQFKLLLEQKAIKYIYPGEITQNSDALGRDNDWQIVMPLKRQSNNSDPASDNSILDEDVFFKSDESQPTSNGPRTTPPPSYTLPTNSNGNSNSNTNSSTFMNNNNNSQMPPPPPYSVAINRHLNNNNSEPITTTAGNNGNVITTNTTGVRFQQRHLSDLPTTTDADGGILPAARARLASLKSLGSKKLNAIKMRLSDNRQKLEEYIPENNLSSFAIMDSPSVTPEPLGNTIGSFYTIQNLRNTYLLSALHCQSNSLSVHSIDIHLKPLFLYKIPKHCVDILISSNLLYAIQYVDIRTNDSFDADYVSTEKEKRDIDTEKLEKLPEQVENNKEEISEKEQLPQNTSNSTNSTASSSTNNTTSSVSDSCNSPTNSINAVGVISSALASFRTGDEDKFDAGAQLTLMRFENETVLNLYQMATYYHPHSSIESISKEEKAKAFAVKDVRSPMDYVKFYETSCRPDDDFTLRQMEIMINEFPKIKYDPCYVVTNKNVYYIQLKKEPFAIFLDAALAGEWAQCREFCTTFDLSFELCIEFAGDYLLRRNKVTQALVTYNTARVKPIRTALKLAMYGHTNALLHLCAMALKTTYLLKSHYFANPILKTIMHDITYRHAEDVRHILPIPPSQYAQDVVNTGLSCSDYHYGVDESITNLQMSPSSQFHLANLLLITLAEKAVNDKNYMPLWNFLVTNTKYHTNMTSIVLCQSGLYSAALILAKTRGVCIDTYLALTSVLAQEFGWYTELNVCLYNLSEPLFIETITYLPNISIDYFGFIQEKLEQIRPVVLKRLAQQLCPFSAILRPIVSHTSGGGHVMEQNDNNNYLYEFCKSLIETYLAVLIHMDLMLSKRECITNALSSFRISYEDNQFAIESSRFKPISAGCAHCSCVVDGVAYFWGSNGVPCTYSVTKSSDPPEPPHAVKNLELLTQLNLEVHAVKCGRQHTLVLTNNGLYSFGNNNLCQLGIGKNMLMSLQPMLIKAFDGKNITILEAGQYHNAAVADGSLYTWGWGVYGQLGHGNAENVEEPKQVEFFKNKKVLQISLGHGHSLVLCDSKNNLTELYVFGSNHFGQLGLGSNKGQTDNSNQNNNTNTTQATGDDECPSASQVKCLLPVKLDVSTKRIRLIHTKFFTNLAVDDDNRMYTWGSSPQALRLANQIKKRAMAKQKLEEHQRNEMSKRFAATLTQTTSETIMTNENLTFAAVAARNTNNNPTTITTITPINPIDNVLTVNIDVNNADNDVPLSSATDSLEVIVGNEDVENVVLPLVASIVDDVIPIISTESVTDLITTDAILEQKNIENTLQHKNELPSTSSAVQSQQQQAQAQVQQSAAGTTGAEPDLMAHLVPQPVDTSEIAGQILQISSGMFHFALISSTCTLYTWGKNLEHQLGTGDKERRAVNKPMPVDTIESPMFVECGADFTLVMTTEYIVKAFGGNSNGQCGRDLGASLDKMKQRVVCMPTTKRLMRFESQCVELPVEINLPRPRIRLDTEPVRYLKCIPQYQASFMQESNLNIQNTNDDGVYFCGCSNTSASVQYKSTTTQVDSAEFLLTGHEESDEILSSLENLSNNDLAIFSQSNNPSPAIGINNPTTVNDTTEQSYKPLANADEAEDVVNSNNSAKTKEGTTQKAAENYKQSPLLSSSTPQSMTSPTDDGNDTLQNFAGIQKLRHYIHYVLYVFHGLYNPDRIAEFSKQRLEYRIRVLMLNFKFIDAFKLSLESCKDAQQSLRLFEYFTKDTGYVPMRRQDLKYFIYYILMHFIKQKLDLCECERLLLADLDYYLLELAYVLYFNNNNTVLEQNLNEKFKTLIAQDEIAANNLNNNHTVPGTANAGFAVGQCEETSSFTQQQHKLDDTDVIFDNLSVKFKTIVCQRLLKFINN